MSADCNLLLRAAEIIGEEARVLRESHAINGTWADDDEADIRATVEEYEAIAAELEREAGV